jgi:hypothetical protein
MRIVGYESGTGYLCERDAQFKGMQGMGLGIDPISNIAAAVNGIVNAGAQVFIATQAADIQSANAQAAGIAALQQAGQTAQAMAYNAKLESDKQAALGKNIQYAAISLAAVAGVALIGWVIIRSMKKGA